ncbi:Uncharacterised protein [Streptococcus pasteurianus]|nr:Uncharacterised protein [Streptococcus pasteurianus]
MRLILPMAFISLFLLLQYAIAYFNTKAEADRSLIRQYFGNTFSDFVYFNFLPYQFGLILPVYGVLLMWILLNPK